MFLAILLTVVVVLVGFYIQLQFSKRHKFARQIGGPPGYPFIGNALEFVNNFDRSLYTIEKWVKEYGGRYTFFFGPSLVMVASEAEDLEKALTSSVIIDKSEEYEMVKGFLGEGLITSSGQHWLHRRKLITPTFHFSILERFINPINVHAKILADILKNQFVSDKQQEHFDVCPVIAKCTLDIICETSMGFQMNAQTGSSTGAEYVNAVKRIGEIFQYREIRPWLRPPFIWGLTAKSKEEAKYLKIVHSFTDQVISDRKAFLASQESNVEKNSETSGSTDEVDDSAHKYYATGKARLALLDLLINAQKSGSDISDMGLREEVTTFIFAGHDTVSIAVSFCLFSFGNFPEVQEKLHRELDVVFQGDNNRDITSADLREMKYLECCIKETLRLYPSAPLVGRQIKKDFQLDENTIIPAGTVLYIPIYSAHRNSKWFPRPNEFIPERFASGSCMATRNPFAYVPFSGGARNCVGQKLAMIEAKIILATILRQFRVSALNKPEELDLLSEIVLRTRDGIKISLRER